MAQFNWTYVSDSGQRHVVGVFHGDNTGHLLVHCNSQVVLIDFHVLESKNYTFFIDDEMLELKLKRQGNGFSYGVDINREVDTPRNRERRATERRHLRLGLMLAGAMVLFVAMIFLGLRYHNRPDDAEARAVLLSQQTSETVARVSLTRQALYRSEVQYSFVANGRVYEGAAPATPAAHGLPLETGDEFLLRYSVRRPDVHEIDFRRPSERQLSRYRQRAFAKHAALHPMLDSARINCVLDALFAVDGPDAYADVFFQDVPANTNPSHNRDTYRKLIADPDVAGRLSRQCR